jgi:hypothetical protein
MMDRAFFAARIGEHRAIEARLDALAGAGGVDAAGVRELTECLARHDSAEEPFLAALGESDPKLAAKLRAQHDEALEIGARLLESLDNGEAADASYLARRLVAIAQHNIIEEERDVFPLLSP